MLLYTSDESRRIGYSFVPDRSWLFNLHIEKFSIQQLKARKSTGTKLYACREGTQGREKGGECDSE